MRRRAVSVTAALALWLGGAAHWYGQALGAPASAFPGDAKLSGTIRQALRQREQPAPSFAPQSPATQGWIVGTQRMEVDSRGLQVYLELARVDAAALSDLQAAGVTIELSRPELKLVQGRVPWERLRAVAQLPQVKRIRLPDYGRPNAQEGVVLTQGASVISADLAERDFGVEGRNIRVGVISDGVRGLAESVASGDLPDDIESRSFRADGDLSAGAEGTAMLEIIHDIAPDAELFFANFNTGLEFIQATDWLASQAGGSNSRRRTTGGVDILAEDIVTFNAGSYDGSSPPSRALSRAAAGGVAVFAAVGNQARTHYGGRFADTDGDNLHEFDVSLGLPRTDNAGETLNVRVQPGETVTVLLQWNDPFGASANDYDLCLTSPADTPEAILTCSADPQTGTQDPTEVASITRGGSTPGTVGITIENFQGKAAPRDFDLYVLGGVMTEFVVAQGSIPNIADAVGAIALGAVDWRAPLVVEDFSSQGPTRDGRLKPDLVTPDGVSVSGAGGFPMAFFGTSAAAPHAAGVAALMLELNRTLTPEHVRAMLAFAARDIEQPGVDPASGYGLSDALRTLQVVASGHAIFDFASATLHVPATRTDDGQTYALSLRYVPGSNPVRLELVGLSPISQPPGSVTATYGLSSGILDVPAVEVVDGQTYHVTLRYLVGSNPIAVELLRLAPDAAE